VEKLARSLFTRYLLAFEVTSVLLVIAVVGAVVLARRTRADDLEAAVLGNGSAGPGVAEAPADEPAEAGAG
jgi:NADH-quinone oxidoreductase subunit J